MKRFISLLYWSLAAVVVAIVLLSVGYNISSSLVVGSSFMPTALAAKFLLSKIDFTKSAKSYLWPIVSVTAALLAAQYFLLFLVNQYLLQSRSDTDYISSYPDILLNPLFLLILIALFVVPEYFISRNQLSRERWVDFISDRRRVKIEIDAIELIESNDTEVTVHLCDGTEYRTKAKISTWEKILDDRFLRVHRSYLVNRSKILCADSKCVTMPQRKIEVSRKYRETVRAELSRRS